MFRSKPSAWDAVAVLFVLTAALLLILIPLLAREEGRTLVISTPEGEAQYSLAEDRGISITSRGIKLCIVIRGGEAWVEESDCPDGICRESRAVSHAGETILCAPAGVRISVTGEGEIDFVAG